MKTTSPDSWHFIFIPYLQDVLPHLRDHLLGRILHHEYDVMIALSKMHSKLRSNFVDASSISTKCSGWTTLLMICVLSRTTSNPSHTPTSWFSVLMDLDHTLTGMQLYAQVIRIFHAIVDHPSLSDGTQMDFLWVCWYGSDIDHTIGLRFWSKATA